MSAPQWCLPLPDAPGSSISGFMELPDGRFCAVDDQATDEHYALAAELARKRLGRCKRGSTNWHWYRAVIAEHERREQQRLELEAVVRSPRLRLLPAVGGEPS